METDGKDEETREKGLNLITCLHVEPAHGRVLPAFMHAIDVVKACSLKAWGSLKRFSSHLTVAMGISSS